MARSSTVHSKTLRDGLKQWDIAQTQDEEVKKFFRAAPGGIITTIAFSQSMLYPDLDSGSRAGLHTRQGTCLFQGRRAGGAARQHRAGRLHRENGRCG